VGEPFLPAIECTLNYITAETLVSEPGAFEIEMATEKLKRHKSPGIGEIGEIPTELIKAGGRTVRSEIYKLDLFLNKDRPT